MGNRTDRTDGTDGTAAGMAPDTGCFAEPAGALASRSALDAAVLRGLLLDRAVLSVLSVLSVLFPIRPIPYPSYLYRISFCGLGFGAASASAAA